MSNTGIYKIYWPDVGYYYIGQAIDIDRRFAGHLTSMKNKSSWATNKMSEAYNNFGKPNLVVLKYCKVNELDHYEQYYIGLELNADLCLNTQMAKPLRRITIKLTKAEHQALSLLANSKSIFMPGIVKYTENLIRQHLKEQHLNGGE